MKTCDFPPIILLNIFDYLSAKELCICAMVNKRWYETSELIKNTRWKSLFFEEFIHIFQTKSSNIYMTLSQTKGNEHRYLMNVFEKEKTIINWKEQYRILFLWSKLWKIRSEEVSVMYCGCISRPLLDNSIIRVGYNGCRFTTVRDAISFIQPYCTIFIGPGVYEEQTKFTISMPIQLIGNSDETIITASFELDTSACRFCNLTLRNPWFTDVLLRVKFGLFLIESCRLFGGEVFVSSPGLLAMRFCILNSTKMVFLKSYSSLVQSCDFINSTGNTTEFVRIDGPPKYERLTSSCNFIMNQRNQWLPNSYDDNTDFEYLKQTYRRTKSFENSISTPFKKLASTSKDNIINMQTLHTKVSVDVLKETKILHVSPYDVINLSERPGTKNFGKRNNSFDELFPQSQTKWKTDLIQKSINPNNYNSLIIQACEKKEVKDFLANLKGPMFVNCSFTNAPRCITVTMESNFMIVNSLISNCGESIKVTRFSKAFIYRCRIQNGGMNGLFLKKGCRVAILGNEIFGMTNYGIELRKNTFPFIMANKIHNNESSGINFLSNGGWVEYNDICSNRDGIVISTGSNPVVRSNSITKNLNCGIVVKEKSTGIIEENLLCKNNQNNIFVSKFSNPIITCNHICKSEGNGIMFQDISKGTVSNNLIEENDTNGIIMCNGALPTIYGNQICRNLNGICVSGTRKSDSEAIYLEESCLDLEENSDRISVSGFEGINEAGKRLNRLFLGEQWIRRRTNLLYIQYNSIYFNKENGIVSYTNCPLEIFSNAIHANKKHGINFHVPGLFGPTYGFPELKIPKPTTSNSLFVKKTSMLNKVKMFIFRRGGDEILNADMPPNLYGMDNKNKIRIRTIGQVIKNSVTNNGECGMKINVVDLTSGRFVLFGNGIYDNKHFGVDIHGECELISNDIIHNHQYGLRLSDQSWIYMHHNRLLATVLPLIQIKGKLVTLVCEGNIMYSTNFEPKIIELLETNTFQNTKKLCETCFNEFRLVNLIEPFPEEIDEKTSVIEISRILKSINDHNSTETRKGDTPLSHLNQLHSDPLKPAIVYRERNNQHTSITLSEALRTLSRNSRSEICIIL